MTTVNIAMFKTCKACWVLIIDILLRYPRHQNWASIFYLDPPKKHANIKHQPHRTAERLDVWEIVLSNMLITPNRPDVSEVVSQENSVAPSCSSWSKGFRWNTRQQPPTPSRSLPESSQEDLLQRFKDHKLEMCIFQELWCQLLWELQSNGPRCVFFKWDLWVGAVPKIHIKGSKSDVLEKEILVSRIRKFLGVQPSHVKFSGVYSMLF